MLIMKLEWESRELGVGFLGFVFSSRESHKHEPNKTFLHHKILYFLLLTVFYMLARDLCNCDMCFVFFVDP